MNAVADAISKSSNPYIYAGHGCTLHREKFAWFINEMQIPVMLSWRAIDLIPEDHPLNAGRPGLIAQPEANKKIQQADLVIIMGARVEDSLTAYKIDQFAPNAVKVVVDIDKAELDRLPAEYYRINMDCGQFMDELLEVVE
jgi:acetolactate synthase-1/2/3 large subunit